MNNKPSVSVIMGIYNCEEYLPEAIESIIGQTYTDWELVMCDDGSKDGTCGIAESCVSKYPDKMILLKNDRNQGLNYSLNRCLSAASGRYIARMDGDDISLPERFEKELAVLENNPDISIVSTAMLYFDDEGDWAQSRLPEFPVNNDFMNGTPFCHAPCMVRREAYEKVGGYTVSDRLLRVEDYHLWVKMYAAGYKGMNLSEPLYKMRDDRNAYKRRKYKYRVNEYNALMFAYKELHLPFKARITALRPLLVGLIPAPLYRKIRKKRMRG